LVKLISKQIAVSTLETSIRLDDVLRSYDLEDTQFEIKVLNEDLDLTDATIHCVTKYFSHGKSYAFEKLIKPKSKDVIVFSLPEELKGYDGKIYVGLYAELGDERVDIKDIEVTINNSIIDEDIDFSTVNYFESFERMVEKVDLATEDALDNIKHDKEHVALSRDYAERKMSEDIEEVDTRAKEVLESINDKDEKVNALAEKFNTDIEDFEKIKIIAKETSDNATREINQTKESAISEIETISDSVRANKTKFDTVVNGITVSISNRVKDLDTYTNEQKLHIDEKTKSFDTLVNDKTNTLTQFNNTFNQELEKAGATLTTAQDLINRIGTLEQKEDKDTVYNDAEIKEEVKNAKSKLDELSEKVASLESRTDNDTVYDDTGVKQSISSVDTKVDKLSAKVTELEQRPSSEAYDDTELSNRVTALERKQDNDTIYDDTELSNRVTALERKQDNDTIYDDSEIKRRITALEQKEDHDTIYDDTEIKKELSELNQSIAKKKLYYAYANDENGVDSFIKADVYDSFYRELYPYFGISDKDSDNPDDYFWMPTRVASDDELSRTTFEVNKLKDLHRKAPTGYTLDRTTIPWTVSFDNGCELRFPKNSPTSERDKANLIYGYGFPANNNSTVAFSAPIPPLIISASRGAFTVDKFKESDEAHFHVTYADYRLYYPIRKSDDFNWENAYGDRVNQTVSTNGKSNFAKLMYELGIWSEADVLYLGATKK
jgi:hypothetical protein